MDSGLRAFARIPGMTEGCRELGNYDSLLPDSRQRQRQKPQHRADETDDCVGLREHTGLNKHLRGDDETTDGQKQAGAADGHRQISQGS
jgi:hypothetical protein